MEDYGFIFNLAMILFTTKILGLVSKRFQMPQVVGALLAGLLFGPVFLNIIHDTSFIDATSEIGVIILMFCAGLETDITELKKSGRSAFLIALIGVLVPLGGGFAVAAYFNRPELIASDATASLFLQNIFMGIILTATSVSITVETLKELGKLKTQSGNAILGAAIIDDILGIIGLTIVTSFTDASVSIVLVLLKTAGFFLFSGVVAFVVLKFCFPLLDTQNRPLHRQAILAFVFCLLMSFAAEEFFGVADITGAFVAGLILSTSKRAPFIASKFDVLSYLYFSPIFFASIGLKVSLPPMSATILAFALFFVLVAIATKIVGCGVGAKVCGYTNPQCLRIGVGMVSRGEVALIVASKGAALGLLGSSFIGPIVVVVVITTILTPIMLKTAYRNGAVPSAAPLGASVTKVHELRHQ